MKKICVITATRAEYGYLRHLIIKLHESKNLQLQLVVTGAHLVHDQGYTIDEIKKDNIPISAEVPIEIDNSSPFAIAETMSRYAQKFTAVFNDLQPDVVFVLGDRYELLPICSASFIMHIPIAHISGGDVTEGALDDGIRNAVTMLATYHFPGTEDSANNIIRMRGNDTNVFTVGELTLDFYKSSTLLSREELATTLNIDPNKKWILLTYHPETIESLAYNLSAVKNIISALNQLKDIHIIITKANTDYGGKEINDYFESIAKEKPHMFSLFSSLGQHNYLSVMKQCALVIGNSSSGIVETPFLSTPTVNVGNRQKGRHQCANIIQSSTSLSDIQNTINKALHIGKKDYPDKYYWGNGNATERIMDVLQ